MCRCRFAPAPYLPIVVRVGTRVQLPCSVPRTNRIRRKACLDCGVNWRTLCARDFLYFPQRALEGNNFQAGDEIGIEKYKYRGWYGRCSLHQARRMTETNSNWRRRRETRAIRCPYCVDGREFRLMLARDSEECFLCANCGHIAMPKHPGFKCPCTKCIALNLRSRARSR